MALSKVFFGWFVWKSKIELLGLIGAATAFSRQRAPAGNYFLSTGSIDIFFEISAKEKIAKNHMFCVFRGRPFTLKPIFRAFISHLQPQASRHNLSSPVASIWPSDIFLAIFSKEILRGQFSSRKNVLFACSDSVFPFSSSKIKQLQPQPHQIMNSRYFVFVKYPWYICHDIIQRNYGGPIYIKCAKKS